MQRHRVARRLRHVARTVIDELDPADRVVIRALPGSRDAISARLEQELRTALRRTRPKSEGRGDAVERQGGRARCAIFLIQLYRHTISPLRLPTCRFTPTCSQYAVDALTEYGVDKGWLARP